MGSSEKGACDCVRQMMGPGPHVPGCPASPLDADGVPLAQMSPDPVPSPPAAGAASPASYDPTWYAEWRELVGDDLVGGYGTIVYLDDRPEQNWPQA